STGRARRTSAAAVVGRVTSPGAGREGPPVHGRVVAGGAAAADAEGRPVRHLVSPRRETHETPALGTPPTPYDIPVPLLHPAPGTLGEYRGKVLLVVNLASRCVFTPQYAGLEDLYRAYRDRGLVVLGFPCNQFLWQEPGTADDIKATCAVRYGVTFPVFAQAK